MFKIIINIWNWIEIYENKFRIKSNPQGKIEIFTATSIVCSDQLIRTMFAIVASNVGWCSEHGAACHEELCWANRQLISTIANNALFEKLQTTFIVQILVFSFLSFISTTGGSVESLLPVKMLPIEINNNNAWVIKTPHTTSHKKIIGCSDQNKSITSKRYEFNVKDWDNPRETLKI